MKKLTFYSLLIVSIAILTTFLSCGEKEDPIVPETEIPDSNVPAVHIAGIGRTSGGVQIAKYWKNGKSTNLSDGKKNAYALALILNENDVYIAGYEETNTGTIAKYWKNGVATNLTDDLKYNYANAIVVNGSDVYVAGYEQTGKNSGGIFFVESCVAKYWKNGVPTNLSDGKNKNYANSITVSGNDVYIAGYEWNAGKMIAKYWKNGIATNLSDDSKNHIAKAIVVNGNDIYVVGGEVQTSVNGVLFNGVAKYWKNGVPINLTDGSFNAEAHAMAINGGDVYIAGQEQNANGVNVCKYWKNGTSVSLTNGSSNENTTSITINGNDVYVTGNVYEGSLPKGRYWKNGIETKISDGIAQSIIVK